jgi:hypothetical protein
MVEVTDDAPWDTVSPGYLQLPIRIAPYLLAPKMPVAVLWVLARMCFAFSAASAMFNRQNDKLLHVAVFECQGRTLTAK